MIPVVLSGGSGTRLWPLSRAKLPKQFATFLDESLMSKTLRRLTGLGSPWALTVRELEVLTGRVFGELGLPREQMLFEPLARNTAPAVALLCRVMELQGKSDAIAGVFPADHLVTKEANFLGAVKCAVAAAERGYVATLGIQPDHPATGFGYIETKSSAPVTKDSYQAHDVAGFREKPDRATAEGFLAAGRFFWNAGIFVFRVETMIGHFQRLMPELWTVMSELKPDLSNLRDVYARAPSVSIDYGIMEKLKEQVCVPCDIGWSDLGSWDDVAKLGHRLDNGAQAIEGAGATGNFAYSDEKKVFGFVGTEDLIVVDTVDATLIARKGKTQDVRSVVDQLMKAGNTSATEHRFELRPWGRFTILRDEAHFKSKIIVVDPKAQISYQSHAKRAEHWIFVKGSGEVILNDETIYVKDGSSVFIPLGAKHRVRNTGAEPLEFIEVQTGTYFGEDDIERYQDDYNRI
ncbi:MAG: mannose-1-phosphate guanylyltransferase/mannose-6-phosphate isomerase [Bdellovibrionaceae bacterium]|nr:mannose-1-phosphate guanylyltransferase/mannose-6-phosphate isomerase [Pseudobdellovibrionaceae bacterium]